MERVYVFLKNKLESVWDSLIYKPVVRDEKRREALHKDAHLLMADAKAFIATGVATKNLQERLDSLYTQDASLSMHDALEILLDHAERNLRT